MAIWKRSMNVSYAEYENNRCECQVRIDGGKIVVSYEDDGPVVYEGREIGPGHFRLDCARKSGRATLHKMPDDNMLEGHWIEGRDEGMWRIQLEEE